MENTEKWLQALDLKYGASPEEVESAYRELSKVWHPDRFLKESPSLRQKAQEKQREINQAYEQLQAYRSGQLPTRVPDERRGMEVTVPDVRSVSEIPTYEERPATKVGRFISDWLAPILRKAVSLSESPQGELERFSPDRPLNQRKASGCGQGQRQGQGRGKGQRSGRRMGRGQGRRQQNRGS